jgi:hypothetical protein
VASNNLNDQSDAKHSDISSAVSIFPDHTIDNNSGIGLTKVQLHFSELYQRLSGRYAVGNDDLQHVFANLQSGKNQKYRISRTSVLLLYRAIATLSSPVD